MTRFDTCSALHCDRNPSNTPCFGLYPCSGLRLETKSTGTGEDFLASIAESSDTCEYMWYTCKRVYGRLHSSVSYSGRHLTNKSIYDVVCLLQVCSTW